MRCFVCYLFVIFLLFNKIVFSYFSVPTFDDAFKKQIAGTPYSIAQSWGSLIASFFETLIRLTIWGNSVIACARMAGFNLLRNTYKPLQSKTIAEFWNRYLFYFKDLLVTFFFYPTFLRCFKGNKQLRVIFATFMAASVGNLIYHFMRKIEFISVLGIKGMLLSMQTYAVYTLLLTAGIVISQLKTRKPVNNSFFRNYFLSPFCIISFFCFVHIFDDMEFEHSLVDAFAFLCHLFGLG